TPGIRALLDSLRAEGHDVTLVAPATNQSGTSAALTLGVVSVTPDPTDPGIFAVGGTPATSVLLGVTGILGPGRRPDLIVSGTNDGANLGPATVISGTVGATIVALPSRAVTGHQRPSRGRCGRSSAPWPRRRSSANPDVKVR
ncbi:MAG: 5'/3'-nucleotidase SurE, partial [Acidobacteriota bacterium]|nr:5'/3'-nucleotidase SurE [Acidobacteriota bacterium]